MDGDSLYFIEVWLPEPYFDTHPRKHWLYVLCSVSWSDSLGPHGLEPTRLLHGIFQAGIWSELPLPTPDILLIQELNPCLSSLLHWQAGSWPLAPPACWSDLNPIRCILSTHLKERKKKCNYYEVKWFIFTPNQLQQVPPLMESRSYVPLQSLKTNGKKKNTFLCAYSWLVWLTWCSSFFFFFGCSSLSLSHKKELNPCQIPKVLLQQILQYPPYDVARENVRICLSEVRQKNYTVVLRWRSIHNQSISFCVSANFNWTTQNLLFLYRNSRVIHESPGWEYLI